MKTVVVTGSQGFLMTYVCKELLDKGYRVVGYDNYSKYGRVVRPHDNHPNFTLVEMDLTRAIPDFSDYEPSYIILGAARIGGISYFHKYAFDLLRDNELILANCYDAILALENYPRVVTISSSMVFEGADQWNMTLKDYLLLNDDQAHNLTWPSVEEMVSIFPPPLSTYGFQKLSCEYWAKGAWEQYKIPYTIVRPFNCIGAYENKAIGESEIMSGNVALQMSHVLPDLINKCLKGQDPLHILGSGSQVRCYTNGKDIARGIVMAMESDEALNEDFNISIATHHSVLQIAELVWKKINPNKPFRYISDTPYEYDVQRRIPDVTKARELLGFEARIRLEDSIDEIVEWMRSHG